MASNLLPLSPVAIHGGSIISGTLGQHSTIDPLALLMCGLFFQTHLRLPCRQDQKIQRLLLPASAGWQYILHFRASCVAIKISSLLKFLHTSPFAHWHVVQLLKEAMVVIEYSIILNNLFTLNYYCTGQL